MVYKQDNGTPILFHEEWLEVLDDFARFAVHIQIDVGPVERGASDKWVHQVEAPHNVVANRGACRGRECHDGDLYNSGMNIFLKKKKGR